MTSHYDAGKVKPRQSRIREAALEYVAGVEVGASVSTISSKNQITLPVHLLRELGLGPGDRLTISKEGSRLVLRPRPKDWIRYHSGSLRGLYGNTRQEIDAYVDELREEEGAARN